MPKLDKTERQRLLQVDPIRLAIVARFKDLGWSVAELTRQVTTVPITHDTVNRYIQGENDLSSHLLTGILLALGWDGKTGWKKIRKNAE